jgi:hypothetical protein
MTNQIINITSDIQLLVTIPMSMPSHLSASFINNNFPDIFKKVKTKLRFFNLPTAPVFKLLLAQGQLEMTFPIPLGSSPFDVIKKTVKEVNMMAIKNTYIKRQILSLNGINITAIPATVVLTDV